METTPASPPTVQVAPEPRPAPTLAPSLPTERISALDTVRGVALLGILLVNMRFFAQPIGMMEQVLPPAESSTLDALAHWFIKIFAEGKFYPLYSMLFGMGLVLMHERIKARGGSFAAVYPRRLAALLLIGLVHAFLLWYGDILIIYSVAGLILFAFAGARARTLLITGVALVGLAAFIAVAVMGPLTVLAHNQADVASVPILTEGTPLRRLFEGFGGEQPIQTLGDPRWMAYETEAYRDGPFVQAAGFRLLTWFSMVIGGFIFAGMAPHVVGMFFIGAGLMKLGIFKPHCAPLRMRFLLAGLVLGLPAVAAASLAPLIVPEPWGGVLILPTSFLFGPLISLAYLALVTRLVGSGRGGAVFTAVGNAGRMGLTCYLLETVLATSIMYWWGLGLFGAVTPAGELGLAVLIYAAVVLFANVWLRFAQFGPVEWLWRSITYWRVPRLRRVSG